MVSTILPTLSLLAISCRGGLQVSCHTRHTSKGSQRASVFADVRLWEFVMTLRFQS
jgi:hypothetical protein